MKRVLVGALMVGYAVSFLAGYAAAAVLGTALFFLGAAAEGFAKLWSLRK